MADSIRLPQRPGKPRSTGITSIHDVRLCRGDLVSILEDFSGFLDIAKIGVGAAYISPFLAEKVKIYQDHDVQVSFGGTMFEKFYYENNIDDYKRFMENNAVKLVEISTGTIDIDLEKRIELVDEFKKDFMVLCEVGKKEKGYHMDESIWFSEMQELLNAGASFVIAEGRASGTAGIYDEKGVPMDSIIEEITSHIDIDKVIFEAPSPKHQMYFINRFGPNVNLGNVAPHDLLLLESQRCGLRNETFFIMDKNG